MYRKSFWPYIDAKGAIPKLRIGFSKVAIILNVTLQNLGMASYGKFFMFASTNIAMTAIK